MKYRLIIIILLNLIITGVGAQKAIGEWQAYLAYHNATKAITVDNLVYALSDGSLYVYDTEDESIKTLDKVNLISDNIISDIAYNKEFRTLVIIYENSNIDLLVKHKELYNIPDLKDKSMSTSKTINSILFYKELVYLSTDFGIVAVDLKKKEIKNSYNINTKIKCSAIYNNQIIAASEQGIYTGKLTDNLLDPNNWKLTYQLNITAITTLNNDLIVIRPYEGVYRYDKDSDNFNHLLARGNYLFMNNYDDKIIVGNGYNVIIISSLNSIIQTSIGESFNHLSYNKTKDMYWGSNGEQGINSYKLDADNKFTKVIQSIIPESPRRNSFNNINHTSNRLLVAGGGAKYNRLNFPGSIMMLENNKWINFQDKEISDIIKLEYKDITSVVQDPRDPQHHFASSWGEGVYEFKNYKFQKLYTMDNSTLETIYKDNYTYIRTNGLIYDKDNNLWVLNSFVDTAIKIMKNDGKWISLSYPEFNGHSTLFRTMFDKRGWFWATSFHSKLGLFCLNTNNTLEDKSDDDYKFITTFINQDGKKLDFYQLTTMAEDKNGAIWLGTSHGPVVINNPGRIFDDNINFTQIKVPRNNGTNEADYLLAGEYVNSICIDGANRKWIATQNNGVYLLSEDGLETIHHFTQENSPLLTNTVHIIAINPKSGEVFFGTDHGLVSYQSDATEAEETFSNDAYAFPNPVNPDYNGVITITGLVGDSNVKITNTSGKLVYTGTSLGGQFTWNGKGLNGKRVSSGVYYVLAADTEGKEGIATKIVMIK